MRKCLRPRIPVVGRTESKNDNAREGDKSNVGEGKQKEEETHADSRGREDEGERERERGKERQIGLVCQFSYEYLSDMHI